jgi:histidine ammonia-lyase
MGTIAARDCIRVVELAEQVTVAGLLAGTQALDLRLRQKRLSWNNLSHGLRSMHKEIRDHSPVVEEDRPLEKELRLMLELVRNKQLSCDWEER